MRDYCYRNADDTVRIKVFNRGSMGGSSKAWDYDVFLKSGGSATFSTEASDVFFTKRDALAWATKKYGRLCSINPGNTVTNGWDR